MHGVSPAFGRSSACHGYGNILLRIDVGQIEGPALKPSGLGGDRDGGLLLGRQPESVEHEVGQIRQCADRA